jgi:integrase
VIIATQTFTRMSDAQAWAERTETAAAGGVDIRAGKIPVRDLLAEWVEYRRRTVAPKTARTDAELLPLMSAALGARSAGTVMPNEIERWFVYLRHQRAQSDGSIRRYRASISSFFAWCVAEHRRADNPVTAARLPTRLDLPAEMRPFTEDELVEVVDRVRLRSPVLADVTLIAGWTGLRWGELRALRVGDVQALPSPAFWVARSQTEGGTVGAAGTAGRCGYGGCTAGSERKVSRRLPDDPAQRRAALAFGVPARGLVGDGGHGSSTPRPQAHGRLLVADPSGGPEHGVSLAGSRLDHHDESLSALPRNGRRYGRS